MSRIGGLLAELGTDSVTYMALGEVAEISGRNVQPSAMGSEAVTIFSLPSFDDGKAPESLGGTKVGSAKTKLSSPCVLAAKLNPHIPRVWRLESVPDRSYCSPEFYPIIPRQDLLDLGYLYYFVLSKMTWLSGTVSGSTNSHKRLQRDDFLKLRIAVPSLEVQRDIVRTLDQFTRLEAELEAELKAERETRRHQYEQYRYKLLAAASRECPVVSLDQLGRIITGRTPKSSESSSWGDELDFITPSDIKNGQRVVSSPTRRLSGPGASSLMRNIVPAHSILVTCIGADMGKTVINENECVTNQQVNSIVLNASVTPDYLFHVLTSMREPLRRQGERGGGTMPIINKSDFSKIEVPLPSLSVQVRTAAKLNKFEALVNDLIVALPAELSARRKQYEFYRERLLTFEEAMA